MAQLTLITRSPSHGDYKAQTNLVFDYTISNTETTAVITGAPAIAYCCAGSSKKVGIGQSIGYCYVNGTQTNPNNPYLGSGETTSITLVTQKCSEALSVTITKTHSPQSIPVKIDHRNVTVSLYSGIQRTHTIEYNLVERVTVRFEESAAKAPIAYITVPAKTSYTISYNANGGQNPPASQTKWYGEALTLSTAQPIKDGYKFKGWAISQENANEGIVTYASGSSYTDNVSINLFAVWELTYRKPTIYNLKVERCKDNKELDDEGTYALVSFDWAVFRSAESRYYGGNTYPYADNSVETCTITVGTQSATPTLTGASGHCSEIVGVGSYDVDTAYDATVSITDSQELSTDNTTTVSGSLPMAFFPLDYNADATALGIFMPAPNDGNGAYFGKTIHIAVETSASIGTTDYEIIDALDDLGWSDLLE